MLALPPAIVKHEVLWRVHFTCERCGGVFRDFESLDYDSLLAAGPKKGKAKRRGDKATEHRPDADDMQMTDEADDFTDAELLPTEDTFLRLADMEAFVQVLHFSNSLK
jgi:hypothetical protein